jgi:tetratricopeptide (TPR) repeat protein
MRIRAATGLESAEFDLAPAHPNPDAAELHAKAAMQIDPGQAAAYSILARLHARRGQWEELDSVLASAEKEVPDDLAPYYRAAEEFLEAHRAYDRATRYLQNYLPVEPEGNEPPREEAMKKFALVIASR